MRKRTEEINVRVYKTEKEMIRRKAARCGMSTSSYLRTLGAGANVKEAPSEALRKAYTEISDMITRLTPFEDQAPLVNWLKEINQLLLEAYYGREDDDGSNKDMGCP